MREREKKTTMFNLSFHFYKYVCYAVAVVVVAIYFT